MLTTGYLSFEAAHRRAFGRPIVRLSRDDDQVFIIIPDLETEIQVFVAETLRTDHKSIGSIAAKGLI
jgi:hypothetical protein